MAHEYSNTALTILRDLAVLDRYRRASDRPAQDAFVVTAGNISLLEVFLSRLFRNFLETDQEMMRNGQNPMEIHLETGSGSSHVIPSALLASLFGDGLLDLEGRGIEEPFELPGYWGFLLPLLFMIRGQARGALLDVNLRAASNEGDITIGWDAAQQGVVVTLQFETSGVEIAGVADIWGHFEGDISQLDVSVVLRPSIHARRLLWESEVTAAVEAVSRIPTISDADLAKKVRDSFETIFKSMLKNGGAQLFGSLLGAVPLRPVTESPVSLASVQQNLQADLNYWTQRWEGEDFPDVELPPELTPPARLQDITSTQLALAFVLGGLDQSIYDASLLPANLRHVVPPSRDFVKAALEPLRHGGLDLNNPPFDWIRQTLELFARRHLEIAHLVNRTDSYSGAHLEQDEVSGQSRLVTGHTPLPGVPDGPGVVCMRYRIALNAVSILVPGAGGDASIECSVGVWHPLLADDPNVVEDAEIATLDRMEGRAGIILGRAGLNLAVVSYLEWGGKVRLSGKVAAGALGGEMDFLQDIAIPADEMELTGEFPPEDPGHPGNRKFIVHYHIQQLPFAKAYDWIAVGFDRVTLPQVSPSQFQPAQIRLLLEGFVNRNPAAEDNAGIPCHSAVVDNPPSAVNLNGWKTDVVYSETDVGTRLSVAVRAVFVNRVTGAVIQAFTASREIPRFSNDVQEEVAAESLVEAVANGAVAEWGIPAGLPATAFVMKDEEEQISVMVTLQNQRFDSAGIPAGLKPKTFDIEFPSVRVENDKDHGLSGVGEVRFTCSVDVRTTGQAEETPAQFQWSGETRVLEAQDPADLELPGPPRARNVKVRPGDELTIKVSGLEFDWPPFDPHDRMGTATMRRTVPEDDALDHRSAGLFSERSSTRDFDAEIKIVTTSKPPAPRFFFDGIAADARDFITQLEAEPGTAVTLTYDGLVEWATSGRLARSVDGQEWVEEAGINTDDPSHSFEVMPNQTTSYRVEVSNVVGSTFSRVLTVQVS